MRKQINNSRQRTNKFLRLLPVAAVLTVSTLLHSCRKTYEVEAETGSVPQQFNVNQPQELMEPYRIVSPYSLRTVRAIRALAATTNDPLVQSRLLANLKPANHYLYYKIVPDTEAKTTALNSWLEADSNRIAVTMPMDSISMFPSLYPESVLDSLQEAKKAFYVTVPQSQPLASAMQAVVLDTLYVPDGSELTLDFMLNLFSANLSNSFISSIQHKSQSLYSDIQEVISQQVFVRPDTGGDLIVVVGLPGANYRPPIEFMRDMTGGMENEVIPGNWTPTVPTGGRITFTENTLGVDEGIRGLRVTALRFTAAPYIRTTDNDGRFSTTLPSWGFSTLIYTFKNEHLKIRSLDLSSGLSGTLSVIRYLLLVNQPEMHIRFTNPFSDINNLNTNFAHGSKKALWGITFNGIQEANDYAVNAGIYSYAPTSRRFLNVMCYYSTDESRASAPMLGYIGGGGGVGITNIVFHTLGLSSLTGNTIGGLLPDMIISQRTSFPIPSRELRQTIYHEYGHTRHYFKANQFTNAHWNANITKTLGATGYGTAIDTNPGDFFALSEGWADFIGHNFAFRKYGTGVISTEINRWVPIGNPARSVEDNYNVLLERVPTYFNNFIPRGLFHDLMDNNSFEEFDFDRIQGHTILQIYNRFNDNTWTIQNFRERWEDEYPNTFNALLFNQYAVDLP